MNSVRVEYTDAEIKEAVLKKIAENVAWRFNSDIEKKVENAFKALDQPTINRMITEYLVNEHIGNMIVKVQEKD